MKKIKILCALCVTILVCVTACESKPKKLDELCYQSADGFTICPKDYQGEDFDG